MRLLAGVDAMAISMSWRVGVCIRKHETSGNHKICRKHTRALCLGVCAGVWKL